ncbi:MAG: GAF and ANTAR domain-containing protein [Nocardioides sp.]
MGEDAPLARVLAEAAAQINAPRTLEQTLDAIVRVALTSVPGFDHVGISVSHDGGRIQTLAATDGFVEKIDALQYDLLEGPCVTALREDRLVRLVGDEADRRWPRFTPQARAVGLRAQMAISLYRDRHTVAGLNFYSTYQDTIDPSAPMSAELFATHAALALGRAREVDDLNAAMETRSMIGQAMGILMERYRISSEHAFHFLTRTSQESNTKLRDVAAEVIRGTIDHERE